MANATDSIAESITAICDRLILTRDPKAIAKGLQALPDQSKTAWAGMYIASELSLTNSGYKLLGQVQIELVKEK
jgi:hypothetical protein